MVYNDIAEEARDMYTVSELSRIAGISVRALHHYDRIGLLAPTRKTESGYRLYDEESLKRLYMIMMFRELKFSLKEIKEMLENRHFDFDKAFEQQIEMLRLQKKQIERLIETAVEIKTKGDYKMSFKAFESSELDSFRKEAKERWGETAAYKEYEERAEGKKKEEYDKAGEGLMAIFAQAGKLRGMSPDCEEVQNTVREIQGFITANYYTCTDEILRGLGQMYVCDERMKENIDKAGGEGTAELVSEAIKIYCR